jgi:hypothetical protein
MGLSLKTHVKNRPTDGREAQLVRAIPYIRICAEEGPPIFIQNGTFYSEGGEVFKKETLPDWAEDEIDALTPEAKKEVGL